MGIDSTERRKRNLVVPQLRSAVDRPAWTTKDLCACNHKYTFNGIKRDYYIRTKGME